MKAPRSHLATLSLAVLAATQFTAHADLIRHWPFDGNFEELVTGDNGTGINGPTFVENRGGAPDAALSVDGSAQQSVNVDGGGGLDALDTGTISLFVKWTGIQDSACCASSGNVTARQSNGVFSNQVIGLSGTDPGAAVLTWQPYSAGGPEITGTNPVGDGTWRHVAITFTPGDHVLYLDGEIEGTSPVTGTMNSNPAVALSIGAWIGDGGGFSTSMIDDLKIFDTALTQAEVQALILPPAPIVLSDHIIPTSASQGDLIGTLSTPAGDAGDTFTYTLVAGDGDTDNAKFQITGDELQAGTFDFSATADDTEFSVRVQATGTPSGQSFEATFTIIAEGDSDADSLPDEYELLWAPDLTVLSGLADADADGDGLTDLEEFNLRTQFPALDPTMADTDGDSLNDGAEIAGAGARPPTDPTNPDTDDDSLTDGVETNTGTFVSATDTGTDPTNPDTDGDGVDDATEVALGSDPNDPNDLPPVSLVGLWRFEGNADDSSGLENHGTVMNGVTFDSDVPAALGGGQSASFTTGVDHDQHILVPHSPTLDITGEITITAWIKPENNAWDGIIAKTPNEGSGLNYPGNYELRTNNGGGLLEFGWEHNPAAANTFTFTAPSASGVTANEWAHVAFTAKAGGDYIYYIGAAEVGRGAMPETFGTELNTNPLYLGNRADLTTIEFHGLMDDVALFSGVLTEGQIQAIMNGDFSAFGLGSSKLQLQIDQVGDDLVISWDSQGGKLYNLRSETDPSDGEPGDWPIFGGNQDLEATPPRNTLTFPLPADPERFFVIEEFDAPPVVILGDNFENGIGDWTTGSDGAAGTEWELGLPSNVGPTDAHSPLNCFGTNLFADYAFNADVWLRSPAIDLSLAGSATLNYWEFKDIEEGFDFGTVRVLNAADDTLLAEIETGIDGVTADWERISQSLPAAALGSSIKIEFRFQSDDISNFAGWYLDDFEVTVP